MTRAWLAGWLRTQIRALGSWGCLFTQSSLSISKQCCALPPVAQGQQGGGRGEGAESLGPSARGIEKMSIPALLLQVGKLRIKEGTERAEHQVSARAGPEPGCPNFQTGCICGRTGETLSPQEQAPRMGCLPALSVPGWPNANDESLPLLIRPPHSRQSRLQQALPQDLGAPGTPCPSEQTRPENTTPPQMKLHATSGGYWWDFSHFIPILDSEVMLHISKRS